MGDEYSIRLFVTFRGPPVADYERRKAADCSSNGHNGGRPDRTNYDVRVHFHLLFIARPGLVGAALVHQLDFRYDWIISNPRAIASSNCSPFLADSVWDQRTPCASNECIPLGSEQDSVVH